MKLFVFACLLAMVGLSMTAATSRGCIYILGKCYRECEEGTHAYTTGCSFLTPEATCDEPNPVPDTRGALCDYSSCYCDEPTVRDTVSGKCVPLDQCPKKEDEKKEEEKKEEGKPEEKKEVEKKEEEKPEEKKEVEKKEEEKPEEKKEE